MFNRKAALSGLVVTAVAFAGACSDVAPTEPLALDQDVSLFGAPVDPQSHDNHRDAQMVRIAQSLPGFGGYFTGEDGTLNVVMKAGASVAPLRAQMGTFNVVEGQYDFVELDAMHRAAAPVMSISGVVFTDADEVANRVTIGVENAAAQAAVEQALAMAGVPLEAVLFKESSPIVVMQTLRDRVRPVAGGLQINFPGFVCTLGFNVRSPTTSTQGFVTNSHCTNNEYGTGPVGTPYAQPSGVALCPGGDNCIGVEVHDLPTFTGGSCPAGRQCRWSDSAGARYLPGVPNAFARIYRTTGVNNLSLTIAGMFNITAERPFPNPGDVMNKVGRTTGWTSGTVVASCANTNVGGTSIPNLTLLCQEHVQGAANIVGSGDSGSAVFDNVAGDNVRLVGLLWGGGGPGNNTFVFSAMNEIRFEHPANIEGHVWRTFPPPPAP